MQFIGSSLRDPTSVGSKELEATDQFMVKGVFEPIWRNVANTTVSGDCNTLAGKEPDKYLEDGDNS